MDGHVSEMIMAIELLEVEVYGDEASYSFNSL